MYSIEIVIPSAFGGLGKRCEVAHAAGLRRVGGHVQTVAIRRVSDIRKRRIPTRREQAAYLQRTRLRKTNRAPRQLTASDAPLWKATGNLLSAVQAEPIFKKDAVILMADVPYGKSRHDLGTDKWMPKKPAMGIVRRNPFFADTKSITAGQIAPLYADGYNAEWERG